MTKAAKTRIAGRCWLGPLLLAALYQPVVAAEEAMAEGSPAVIGVAEATQRSGSLAERYWVPRAQLTPEQLLNLPGYCSGHYLPPAVPTQPQAAQGSSDPRTQAIYAQAQRLEMVVEKQADLTGDVRITQGSRRLTSDAASIDLATRQLNLNQPVLLQDSEVLLQGQTASADLTTKAATLTDAEFLLLGPELRGSATTLDQNAAGDKVMRSGVFTRCEPGNNNWSFRSSSLKVKNESPFAVARNAVLRVRNVPVFYTPYISFPVTDERLSGWLFPTVGYSSEDGFDLAAPYYLNLAPHYDATITPKIMSKRGVGVEAEFRHLSGWGESIIGGGILPEDKLFDGTYDKDDFQELFPGERFEEADRWLLNLEHLGQLGRFRTLVDYTAVSDRDYFRDLGTDLGLTSRVDLERRAQVSYTHGGFEARLWAQRFQSIDEQFSLDPYQRLPELDLAYRQEFGQALGFPLQWSIASKISRFDRDTKNLSGLNAVTGNRTHVEPRVQLPMNWSFGFINLTGGYRFTRYQLDADDAGFGGAYDERRSRNIGFGSADAGLYFDRDVRLFGRQLIQTLEPRMYYLRQGFEEQNDLPAFDSTTLTFSYSQLYRDNRFAGLDRIGDANQLSTGVTTRFIDSASGQEYLRASIGEIWYFRDRKVGVADANARQSSSALAAEVAASFPGGWRATGNLIWDPHDNQVDESSVALQFRPDARRILNLGYRNQVQQDIEQTDLSLYWPVSNRLAVIGRWNYDLVSGRTIEAFGGLEYNDCCVQVRLLSRRFIDSPSAQLIDTIEADNGVFLQIVFKGLAGFGNRVEGVLTRGIRGYSSPEYGGFFTDRSAGRNSR